MMAIPPTIQEGGLSNMNKNQPIQCPNCGNTQIKEINLHVSHLCYTIHTLGIEASGAIYAKQEQAGIVHHNRNLGERLYCNRCQTTFDSLGIPLK